MVKMDEAELMRVFSQTRVDAYGKSKQTHNLAAHAFNTLAGEVLYPLLQLTELALRNNLDHVLKEHYGLNWLNQNFFKKDELDKIKQARKNLKQVAYHDKLIAELNYGFWTGLLEKRYEGVLWPKLIEKVFPYVPRKIRTRLFIFKRFSEIRKLRNRVFHHKQIVIDTLPEQHRKIHEAIKWLSIDLHPVAVKLDRFPAFYQSKEEIIKDLESFYKDGAR